MALENFWGFNNYDSAQDAYDNGWGYISGFTIDTDSPQGGGKSTYCGDMRLPLVEFYDVVKIVGFHMKSVSNPNNSFIFGVCAADTSANDGANHLRVALNPTRNLVLYRGNTLLATSTAQVTLGVWNHYQIKFKVHETTGSFELKLNGTTIAELTFSGDTANTTSATRLAWGATGNSDRITNIYIANTTGSINNDYLGEVVSKAVLLNADVSNTGFTLSTGSIAYQLLDEHAGAENDTDYITSNTATNKIEFGFEDLADAQSICGFKLHARMGKDDTGSRGAKLGVKYSGTEQQRTEILPVGLGIFNEIFETSDGATTLFTQTTLNATTITVETT